MQVGPGLEMSQWTERYTFWPKKMSSGLWIWNCTYWEKRVYCDREGIKPIRKPYWSYLYSDKEYLVQVLKGKVDEPIQQTIRRKKDETRESFYSRLNSRGERAFGSGPKSTGSKK
jgi:hypothetical protein